MHDKIANQLHMLSISNSNDGFQITNYTNTNRKRRTQHLRFYTDCAHLQTNSSINCYMASSIYKEIYFLCNNLWRNSLLLVTSK